MTAYVLMAGLTALALLLLMRPWWQRRAAAPMVRRDANVAAYRTRCAEIEADVASGVIDAAQAESLKQELGVRLLADAEPPDTTPIESARRHGRLLPLGLSIAAAAFAAAGYFTADSWRTQQTLEQVAAHPDQAQALMVQAMVERLQKRLQKSPDDAEGWAMLGRSHFVMQHYADAAQAYARANALNGAQNADWLVGEGESRALAQGRELAGEPAQRFEQALRLDPDSGKALWYAGLAAAQAHDYAGALQHWLRLRGQQLPPDLAEALEQRLQELSPLSGLKIPDRPKVTTPVSLRVRVTLAPALVGKLPAGATLFVFAKAAEGPPMPLAVQKLDAAKLPLELTLDDSMAMTPALRLSQFDHWLLTARVSRSGGAQPLSGDFQGQLRVDRAQAADLIRLVISEVVP